MTGAEYIVEAYDYDDDTDYKEVCHCDCSFVSQMQNVRLVTMWCN